MSPIYLGKCLTCQSILSIKKKKDTCESQSAKSINQPYKPKKIFMNCRVSKLSISPISRRDTYDSGSVKSRNQPCLSISFMSLLLDDTSRALWKSSSSLMIFPDLRDQTCKTLAACAVTCRRYFHRRQERILLAVILPDSQEGAKDARAHTQSV